MDKRYLELLFQHKFEIDRSLNKLILCTTFPAGTSDYDVNKARIECLKSQRDDLEKLIDAYISYHTANEN